MKSLRFLWAETKQHKSTQAPPFSCTGLASIPLSFLSPQPISMYWPKNPEVYQCSPDLFARVSSFRPNSVFSQLRPSPPAPAQPANPLRPGRQARQAHRPGRPWRRRPCLCAAPHAHKRAGPSPRVRPRPPPPLALPPPCSPAPERRRPMGNRAAELVAGRRAICRGGAPLERSRS
jgi:hypothetical protein